MNILVTGANGFIGQSLSVCLKAKGHHVFGLSLKSPSDASKGFTDYFLQDITKPFSLDQSFDFVIHLAAYNITHVGAKDAAIYSTVNVEGTRHLLQGVHTRKSVYLSTVKVYKNEGLPVDETSPLAPQGAYEQSKLAAEELCRSLLTKESLVILRSVNVIGWGQAPKAVLPVFYQKAKTGQPLDIIYAPDTPMQFVYVEDLIDAMEAVINHDNISGVFNIAHGETTNLEQLARTIITMTHSSSDLNISGNTTKALFSPVVCDKAWQQLGWKANTGLTKILELYGKEYARAA